MILGDSTKDINFWWVSIVAWGFSLPQMRTLCLLTLPFIWYMASSLNTRCSLKSSSVYLAYQHRIVFAFACHLPLWPEWAAVGRVSLPSVSLVLTKLSLKESGSRDLFFLWTFWGFASVWRTHSTFSSAVAGHPDHFALNRHPLSWNFFASSKFALLLDFIQALSSDKG